MYGVCILLKDSTKLDMFGALSEFSLQFALFVILPQKIQSHGYVHFIMLMTKDALFDSVMMMETNFIVLLMSFTVYSS